MPDLASRSSSDEDGQAQDPWQEVSGMKKIMIDTVTRIEGHAKISIYLNEDGKVSGAQLHVTQVRGFEKFTEGRPFYEMPGITARICGICPVSHLLASVKACDAIMAVQIPETARCSASCCTAASSCNRTRSASSTSRRPTCCSAWIPIRPSAT